MKNKWNIILIIAAVVVVLAGIGVLIFKKFAPSFTQRTMSEQYNELGKEEALMIVNGFPIEDKGKVLNDTMYVPLTLATDLMNERLYWDAKEGILSLATVQGLIRVNGGEGEGSTTYTLGNETIEAKNQVLYQDGDVTWISMDFVEQYSCIEYEAKKEPNRILVKTDFDTVRTFAKMADDVRLRVGPNKKYDYLLEIPKDTEVLIDTAAKPENEYQKILTTDGIEGYVPVEYLTEQTQKPWKTEKQVEVFPRLKEDAGTICLGWHQMMSTVGSAELEAKIANAKSLNVISPTWFALSDNKGNFTSIASTEYVTAAHSKGLKVWGLINDFDTKISLKKVLGRTTNRTNLVNNLVTTAIKYDLDGLNIDFEKITEETAPAYLQFLRELTLRCHANDITVSVDDYLPTAVSSFYHWSEQGRIVDYVIFMAYDEHYAGSEESGSVSSLPFVKKGVDLGLEHIPAERVVVALPFYTRLWKETKVKGKTEVSSSAYGMSSAESVLQANGATTKWDDATNQYYAQFKADGATYKIWLEEETSLEKKLEVVFDKKVAGVAFWKLGFERPVTWTTIEKHIKK
nr:hypothetical protein [Eubacterium sp.]